MSPEEKKTLEEVAALARENHQILKRMQRARRWGRFFWLLKWLIIIGLTVWLYYYLRPFIDQLFAAYQNLQSGLGEMQKIKSPLPTFNNFLQGFKTLLR